MAVSVISRRIIVVNTLEAQTLVKMRQMEQFPGAFPPFLGNHVAPDKLFWDDQRVQLLWRTTSTMIRKHGLGTSDRPKH